VVLEFFVVENASTKHIPSRLKKYVHNVAKNIMFLPLGQQKETIVVKNVRMIQ